MAPNYFPEGWIYVSETVSSDLHPLILKNLLSTGIEEDEHAVHPLIEAKQVDPRIEIRPISSPSHPLYLQRGVFAKKNIPRDTDIGQYVGEARFIATEWKLDEKDYDYAWTTKVQNFLFIIDAKKWANELAFVNDFRGIAEAPSLIPKWVIHRGSFHLIFQTSQDIAADSELLIDYGEEYWKAPHRNHS